MHKNIGGDRPLRVSDCCGVVDDHPRHVIGQADGVDDRPSQDTIAKILDGPYTNEVKAMAIAQLNEPGLYLHLDCCRARGCPDGTCGPQTAGAEDLRGGELLEHLIAKGEAQ